MKLQPWDLRDPAAFMSDIAERVPLPEDAAYLALVEHPSSEQRILSVKPLPVPALLDDGDDISEDLCDAARSFGVGCHRRRPQHALVTVIVRPGRCVFGPNEAVWLNGWHHPNHFESAFSGDLVLVTEHGWADLMSAEAGHEPRVSAGGT